MHTRYFGSTFKCTDTYGWFSLADAHREWFCTTHWTHHVFSGDQYTSGFEVAEAYVWQEFQSDGHAATVKDLNNYHVFDVGHGLTAVNTRYAHYISILN